MMRSAAGKAVRPSREYEVLNAEEKEKHCAVCGRKGTKVFRTTMLNHTEESTWPEIDDSFRFSDNTDCDVVYFSNSRRVYFFQDEVKTIYGPMPLPPADSIAALTVTAQLLHVIPVTFIASLRNFGLAAFISLVTESSSVTIFPSFAS